jgi:hypothetical protein
MVPGLAGRISCRVALSPILAVTPTRWCGRIAAARSKATNQSCQSSARAALDPSLARTNLGFRLLLGSSPLTEESYLVTIGFGYNFIANQLDLGAIRWRKFCRLPCEKRFSRSGTRATQLFDQMALFDDFWLDPESRGAFDPHSKYRRRRPVVLARFHGNSGDRFVACGDCKSPLLFSFPGSRSSAARCRNLEITSPSRDARRSTAPSFRVGRRRP